ncbi:MAG: gliding motility protein GldL [Bacteroidetes bacterium]|nr:gliding motility protein GldL [Bacteroidota bacterium]
MTFAEFAETKKFKTIMNYIYSLGAAVVIAGALFKIQHWPGANLMLNIGMGTEVFVFCIFAIDPTQVHMDLDWSLVYPELAGMHDEEGKEENKPITEQLDNMLEEAKIGPELIASLGSGMKNLSEQTAKLNNITDAGVAASNLANSMKSATTTVTSLTETYDKSSKAMEGLSQSYGKASNALEQFSSLAQQEGGIYTEQLQKASKNISSLNSAYELQVQASNENVKVASKANEGMQKLLSLLEASMEASQRDAVSYGEHLKKTAGNIESLNAAYELQLQTTKEHISKSGNLYAGVERTLASLNESSEDAQKFKQQMGTMAENLSALNTVYGNMLTAMSIGRK